MKSAPHDNSDKLIADKGLKGNLYFFWNNFSLEEEDYKNEEKV